MDPWTIYWGIGFGCLALAVVASFMVRYQEKHGIDPRNPRAKPKEKP